MLARLRRFEKQSQKNKLRTEVGRGTRGSRQDVAPRKCSQPNHTHELDITEQARRRLAEQRAATEPDEAHAKAEHSLSSPSR